MYTNTSKPLSRGGGQFVLKTDGKKCSKTCSLCKENLGSFK